MLLSEAQVRPYALQLEKVRSEALYSAQTYYEACKRLDSAARRLIFLPSCASAIAGFAVAIGAYRWIGGISALASVMVATASYIGVDRKAASYRRTAGQMTALRHRAALELDLAREGTLEQLEQRTREASRDYQELVTTAEPTSNKDFALARKRIADGFFE